MSIFKHKPSKFWIFWPSSQVTNPNGSDLRKNPGAEYLSLGPFHVSSGIEPFSQMKIDPQCGLVMSNQRFFKIVCFSFPQKIEYILFLNKIRYRNKTFSLRSQNFWSKSNWFVQFPNFSWDYKEFCFDFRNLWTKSKRFGLFEPSIWIK